MSAMNNSVYLISFCVIVAMCTTLINKDGSVSCSEVPQEILEEVLGAAFNARYMSIDVPVQESSEHGKRETGLDLDFYVDSDFYDDMIGGLDKPAWSIKNHVLAAMRFFGKEILEEKRYRRDMDYLQEWHCKSRIRWTDLGPDYFPRYLRSVECVTENCWFNIYRCRSKSFTLKLLRRKPDRCVLANMEAKVGISGLPGELRELWVWEEKAVSFCCDCSI